MRNRDMPAGANNADGPNYDGLTKREAAAIAAMQGMLAHDADLGVPRLDVPREAVSMADSLFDELDKEVGR